MCQFVKVNKCSITNSNCPFMYFCNKVNDWRPMNSMPKKCKVQEQALAPKGWYKVRMERRGFLYIDIEGQTRKFPNPFDEIPLYVKIIKQKNGTIKLKKYEG